MVHSLYKVRWDKAYQGVGRRNGDFDFCGFLDAYDAHDDTLLDLYVDSQKDGDGVLEVMVWHVAQAASRHITIAMI